MTLKAAVAAGERKRDDLLDELKQHSFRLAGERRYASARATLAEASRHALEDIVDSVGGVKLTRHELIGAIHAALEVGRYVEIRGDAGVGKSGLLKHFAHQVATEAPVIVLSPGRTIPRGWTAMKAVLGFDGTARELLVDLAGDGGAILFVDNLDFFEEEERRTVVDLIREASTVPGFAVVATARRKFGVDEPSWLPAEALNRLGRAEPLVIGEPIAAEVGEMRQAAPGLALLLSDSHPARNVARNLFRLYRLAGSAAGEPTPRSEAEMAERWWQTADGPLDDQHRERSRVLRVLAEQALTQTDPLQVRDQSAAAVNALIGSESVRDLGADRVAFRHDVLREWAIANLLHGEPANIDRLPLDQPAPPALARGVELAARMAIERGSDSKAWQSLLERMSRADIHGSWRRGVLLALVRSEISTEVLTRAEEYLLADRAVVLRELARVVMAVDAEPAARVFTSLGFQATAIPASLTVPSGPSWYRLIIWLLRLGDRLPPAAIPDVFDLYSSWSSGMLGLDPLTPLLQKQFYRWLDEIETARDGETYRDMREPFGGEIDYERMRSLASDIRSAFLLFAVQTPDLAAEYVKALGRRRRGEDAIHSILKFRGTLAQAAPAELAQLTAEALIRKPESKERRKRGDREEPFDYVDHDFLPTSPSQGPFLELLTHAPQHGLSLIRRLVDHAISFYSRGRQPGVDALILAFPDGDRSFPWKRSYIWSRDANGNYSVTSSLMALEAWAHRRIEAGESFDAVLREVLGPPGTPAAYVLIAVDLILSHWPNSRELAAPFLACPELLCLDRERQMHDSFEYPDFFGLKALQKEPAGAASIEDLKKRVSRKVSVERPLGQIAIDGPVETRNRIVELLGRAAERLGSPEPKSTLADPRLMTRHAINLLDPANWQEVSVTLRDGSKGTALQYVSPEKERKHLAALQAESQEKNSDLNMQLAIGSALEDASKSSTSFAAAAVKWAQSATGSKEGDDASMREQAIVSAAMISMRDGDAEVRAAHAQWVCGIFSAALQAKEDAAHRFRSGLRFNPVAIAFAGTAYAAKDDRRPEAIRGILEIAARGNPAAAHGFGVVAPVLSSIDERLPRAVIRCGFAACIRRWRDWSADDDKRARDAELLRKRASEAVDAEMAWLSGSAAEPNWPQFPGEKPRRKRRIRLPGGPAEAPKPEPRRPEEYADDQAAALWLTNARGLGDIAKNPWLCDVARTYGPWTMAANGAGLDRNDDVSNPPREWNSAYFEQLARCLVGLSEQEIARLALAPLATLPDESFFDAVEDFLPSVDAVYFDGHGIEESVAVGIRSKLADRLMESSGWKWMASSNSASVERHLGSAIAALFFSQQGFTQPAKCYLLPKGIDGLQPFLSVLERLVKGGPSLSIAVVTLNLLEVSPRPAQLPFLVAAAKAWVDSYRDNTQFWVDYGIGRRVCHWIASLHGQDPALLRVGTPVRGEVDRILAGLIRLGVADARQLEKALAGGNA